MKSQIEDDLFTDIDSNVQQLMEMIQSWIDGKRVLKSNHSSELDAYDEKMLAFLWRCRGLISTTKIAKMIGLSRQALYTKWRRYGYTPDDSDQSPEQ